jgi:LPXTG-motif cell wall-anchored protein
MSTKSTTGGNWYDFGFVLGAGILFGGGFMGRRRKRHSH